MDLPGVDVVALDTLEASAVPSSAVGGRPPPHVARSGVAIAYGRTVSGDETVDMSMLAAVSASLPSSAELLRRRYGLSQTVAAWLTRSGHPDPIVTDRFLNPRLADLTRPDDMADREVVARRLAKAVRQGELVAIFGDYDCDGITSCAIMTEVLRALGGRAVPLLASRFDGGYGVSPAAVERILATRARVLVTCDCGSSDHAALRSLTARGLDVVVIDHHLVPDEPLPAIGFLNPHRLDCGFAYKGLASCGLSLSIAAALRKELGVELDVRYWLDLVAVGTVADVAPLDGDNRALVRAGLDAILKARRPGMQALLEVAKISRDAPLTGRDVAFRIAPHINAPGRLGAADIALDLLLARDLATARSLAATLEQLSDRRRALSEEMFADASAEIERSGFEHDPAIVVGRNGWNPGIVGIVAGRLVDRYQRPVIVVGFDGTSGRGSVRGPSGARLHDALCEASDLLIRFGGHQQAAGVELLEERLGALRARFSDAVARQGEAPRPGLPGGEPLPLDANDDPLAVLADLGRLEPCGFRNPRPRIVAEGRVSIAREVKNGHLKLELTLDSRRRLDCFAPRRGELASSLSGRVRVVGDLRHNGFSGVDAVELLVDDVGPAVATPEEGGARDESTPLRAVQL
jgi:single-stranded-DNA-specific exonuclease